MLNIYHLDLTPRTELSAEMAAVLSKAGQRRRFAEGSWVQQRGDDGDGFWLIESGKIAMCRHGAEGEQTIFAVRGSGDLFGELAYFARTQRQVDAIARADSTLVWLDNRTIRDLLAREPAIATSLLASLANQLRTALDRIDIARHGKAETRLAAALLDMAQYADGAINCTQQELSDFIGVSRVRTGALLSQFAKSGIVRLGYGQIEIIDMPALQQLLPD